MTNKKLSKKTSKELAGLIALTVFLCTDDVYKNIHKVFPETAKDGFFDIFPSHKDTLERDLVRIVCASLLDNLILEDTLKKQIIETINQIDNRGCLPDVGVFEKEDYFKISERIYHANLGEEYGKKLSKRLLTLLSE